MPGLGAPVEREGEEDPDKLNPTVVRLSKELREEKANGRWLKKNWRQAQADHQAAAVEVTRFSKELDITKKALLTEQEICERLQDDIAAKQAAFVKSDVRACRLNQSLYESNGTLAKLEVVEKQFAKDLADVRKKLEVSTAETKEQASIIALLGKQKLALEEKAQTARKEERVAQNDAENNRRKEAATSAKLHELGRQQRGIVENAADVEKNRVDVEAYAHRIRGECEIAQKKLAEEQDKSKTMAAELKKKSFLYQAERETSRKYKHDLQEESTRILGLRKDKTDAENIAIGVKREHAGLVKVLSDKDAQLELQQSAIDVQVAKLQDLEGKLKDREATIKELKVEVKTSQDQGYKLRAVADAATKDVRRATDETQSIRKMVASEKNATFTAAQQVNELGKKLKASDLHSGECDEVINRLTKEVTVEHQKIVKLEAVIVDLHEEVAKWKERLQGSQETIKTLQGSVKAEQEEVSLTRRMAKDSLTASVKLSSDIGGIKNTLRSSEAEVVRLDEQLDQYRKQLVERNIELEAEKEKVLAEREMVKVEKAKILGLKNEIFAQSKLIAKAEEEKLLALREVKTAQETTHEACRELATVSRKHKEVAADIPEIVDAGQRALQQVEFFRQKAEANEPIIAQLKIEVAANLKRAIAAEAVNTGHEKKVAELQELCSHAKNHDSTASALTTKMGTRLYEAQKKLPILQQEADCYKEHVERLTGETNALKDQIPKQKSEITRLTADLEASKKETWLWRDKVKGFESQIAPLKDQVAYLTGCLGEEKAMKVEMAKQVRENRKITADAQAETATLTQHVERLISQLQAEGSEPKSPKSPKSTGFGKLKGAMNKSQSVRSLSALKPSASLPAIK